MDTGPVGEQDGLLRAVNVGEDDGGQLEVVDDHDIGEIIEAEVEEADPKRSIPTPEMPSPSDVERHREDHIPYASWCDHCVEGRGREMGHSRVDRSVRTVSTFSFDYLFLNDDAEVVEEEGVAAGSSDDAPRGVKVLVAKDGNSRALFAHVVPAKGVDERRFSVDALVDDIKWLGYTRMILKSDNEPAIVRLLSESSKDLRISVGDLGQVMEEHPPPFDSQANGDAEAAAKAVQGQVRSMQSCLEARIGYRIPMAHPIMAWMIPHAALLMTNRVRGHDGKTAYSRVRGRPFSTR